MKHSIDWLYHRKNCVSCKRARDFLEQHAIDVKSSTDATRERRGPAEALALAKSVAAIQVARGKKILSIDMKKDAPEDDTLVSYLLGPSGNLRAPTIRRGNTLYVGFNEEAYQALVT
jgi:arsenate reductase-like glutaredoxin family protein